MRRFLGPYLLFVSVRIQENTGQKKLRIWTLFTQWYSHHLGDPSAYFEPRKMANWSQTLSDILYDKQLHQPRDHWSNFILVSTMFAHASLWFRQCSKIRFRDGVRVTLKICFLSGCLSSRSASLEHKKQNVSHQNGSILDLDFFGLEVVTSLHCSEISLCLWKLYGNLF